MVRHLLPSEPPPDARQGVGSGRVPFAPPASDISQGSYNHSAPHGPGSLRVLVVDDLPDAADSLAWLVGAWGHDARVARDGPSALAEATAFAPQVVLLDVMMPGMSGGEVAARLRQRPDTAGVVLVATTANSPDDPRLAPFDGLFDHFLRKPFDPARLEQILHKAAGASAGRDSVARHAAALKALSTDAEGRMRAAEIAYQKTVRRVKRSLDLIGQRLHQARR